MRVSLSARSRLYRHLDITQRTKSRMTPGTVNANKHIPAGEKTIRKDVRTHAVVGMRSRCKLKSWQHPKTQAEAT